MQIRTFEESDYWQCAAWWIAAKWPPVRPAMLSTYGVIASVDGSDAAAAWLYIMSKEWAVIEWIVANPAIPLKPRTQAIKCVVERLRDDAARFGIVSITSSLKSRGLIRLYSKLGFVPDSGMTNMSLRLR